MFCFAPNNSTAAALLENIGAAEAFLRDPDATQDEIDAAAAAITLAMDKASFEWWRVETGRMADDYAKPGDSEA